MAKSVFDSLRGKWKLEIDEAEIQIAESQKKLEQAKANLLALDRLEPELIAVHFVEASAAPSRSSPMVESETESELGGMGGRSLSEFEIASLLEGAEGQFTYKNIHAKAIEFFKEPIDPKSVRVGMNRIAGTSGARLKIVRVGKGPRPSVFSINPKEVAQ